MTPGPSIRPTQRLRVAGIAVGALLVMGLLAFWWRGQGGSLPVAGVVSWASVALLAVGMGWLARRTRQTLAADRAALDPQQAVTRLLLGKTSQVAGALLLGTYGALAVASVDGLPAPLAVERVVHGSLAALACAGWVVAGARLETACRLPDDHDDDSPDTRHGNPGSER